MDRDMDKEKDMNIDIHYYWTGELGRMNTLNSLTTAERHAASFLTVEAISMLKLIYLSLHAETDLIEF